MNFEKNQIDLNNSKEIWMKFTKGTVLLGSDGLAHYWYKWPKPAGSMSLAHARSTRLPCRVHGRSVAQVTAAHRWMEGR
jgi:hypothetical protein